MKKLFIILPVALMLYAGAVAQTNIVSSRMNEVFQLTDLASGPTRLYDPWEITYGSDGFLWITEAKGYKVYRMDPATGIKTMVLDISKNSTFLPLADRPFNCQFNTSQNPWPQGGMAGLALHPDFMNLVTPKKYVYISYVHQFDSTSVFSNGGVFFTNRVVRFTYNTGTNQLESPVSLCDTLPGSSDHNSQRMIIAPVNGTPYLFYGQGDMGAGQFNNLNRDENAQVTDSYEGKILRFNLEPDGDVGILNQWIPNDNPFNGAKQSAVWSLGIRNNQGFAFATINGSNILYGSSHGPFSDDEINIIERGKNYGHPLVIGYSADGNFDNAKAGPASGSLPLIVSEAANAASIGAAYKDPIFSFYPAPAGNTSTPWSIQYIYTNQFYSGSPSGSAQNLNLFWASEAPSGMDIYTNSMIPGWKNSLMLASLKGGRIIRLNLKADGSGTAPNGNTSDTLTYFRSVNRFRDLAIAPDGKTIFAIIDSSATTSGPTTANPIISSCRGCVQKYTFLGYLNAGSTSTIPSTIPIALGKSNICENANSIDINNTNNNLWVPITDTNSNVVAEINANGNNLGNVTTSLYINTGTVRETFNHTLYLDRNITITPQTQPASPVSIRLYLTTLEFNALKNATNSLSQPSGIATIGDLAIFKSTDACGNVLDYTATKIAPSLATTQGGSGYVLQASINSFSTFYFANTNASLPLHLLSFKGYLNNNIAQLQWLTESEDKTSTFVIERGIDGLNFDSIGTLRAKGGKGKSSYHYSDPTIIDLLSTTAYYRLKIKDVDGKYTYSFVAALSLANNKSTISLYPNPVTNIATVFVHAAVNEKVNWVLLDNTGNTVQQDVLTIRKGENKFSVNLTKLPSGIYYLQLAGSTIDNKIKLQKL